MTAGPTANGRGDMEKGDVSVRQGLGTLDIGEDDERMSGVSGSLYIVDGGNNGPGLDCLCTGLDDKTTSGAPEILHIAEGKSGPDLSPTGNGVCKVTWHDAGSSCSCMFWNSMSALDSSSGLVCRLPFESEGTNRTSSCGSAAKASRTGDAGSLADKMRRFSISELKAGKCGQLFDRRRLEPFKPASLSRVFPSTASGMLQLFSFGIQVALKAATSASSCESVRNVLPIGSKRRSQNIGKDRWTTAVKEVE